MKKITEVISFWKEKIFLAAQQIIKVSAQKLLLLMMILSTQ